MDTETAISIVLPNFTDNQVKIAKLGVASIALVLIYRASRS
jgi:hypothetical protein